MDVKALAKSKRDHTRQHSKKHHGNHPGNKLKAPTQSSSSGPNDTAKVPFGKQQVIEKKTNSRSHGSPALPNNWDRYEDEELDFGPESSNKTLDVVVPKSKGADFRHLVAEAQSHADKTLDGFDGLHPWELGLGLSSILAVRGEGILSWAEDDNFVVQDKTSAYQEASFTFLNLHAIAEKLAKVDLSKRLFIESDLLPTESCVEDLAVCSNEESDKQETTEDSELAKRMSKELNLDNFATEQLTPSSSCSSSHAASTSTLSNDKDIHIPVYNVGVEDTIGKKSTFEATAAAEKELDMLLDSLGETSSNASFPISLGVSSIDLPQISNKEPVPSKIASITSTLDDALDDLLEDTSTLMNPNVLLRPQEEKPPVHNSIQSSSHSGSKPEVSDDFDSWFDTL